MLKIIIIQPKTLLNQASKNINDHSLSLLTRIKHPSGLNVLLYLQIQFNAREVKTTFHFPSFLFFSFFFFFCIYSLGICFVSDNLRYSLVRLRKINLSKYLKNCTSSIRMDQWMISPFDFGN